jgi:hypothetical protein
VARAESAMGRIYADLAQARRAREERKQAEALSWKARKAQLANLAPTDTILHALVDDEKERKRAAEAESFRTRALAEAAAAEAAAAAAAAAHSAQRESAREQHSRSLAQHWAAAQVQLLADARQRNAARAQELSAPPQPSLAREVWERHRGAAEEQVLGPTVDASTGALRELGIFGVAAADGTDSGSDSDDVSGDVDSSVNGSLRTRKQLQQQHGSASSSITRSGWVKDSSSGLWRRVHSRQRNSSSNSSSDASTSASSKLQHLPGVDDAEVQLFTSQPHTAHEERRTAAEEAEVMTKLLLYTSVLIDV